MPSVTIFCPYLGVFGGTENHIVEVSSLLARSGWKVHLAALRNNLNSPAQEKMKREGVALSEYPHPGFFWSLLRRTDVLYTNSQGNASPLLWRLKAAKQAGFHHVHTSADPVEQSYWRDGFKEFVRNARHLVACSETTCGNLKAMGAAGRLSFLPYITLPIPRISREAASPDGKLRFAFLGRIEKPKGIDLILEAAGRPECAGIEWHFHGDGDYVQAIREAARPTIFLHGRYSGADAIAKIHSTTDAIVLPSWHSEGMPLSLLEGMANGVPWIATDRGGTKELAGNLPDCLIFEAGDVEGFIKSVLELAARIRGKKVDHSAIMARYDRSFCYEATTSRWLAFMADLVPTKEPAKCP